MSPEKADQLLRKLGFGSREQVANAVARAQTDLVLARIKSKLKPEVDKSYMQELADTKSYIGASMCFAIPKSPLGPIESTYDPNDYNNQQGMCY
tara:strand:+ start:471 stop:752 length:282 start_codon:yes stop_codon:yes gene_type:complete